MKQRGLSGSVYSAGAVIYATVALLAVGKLLTNALSPEAVGQVALVLLAGELLGLLGGLGLPAALPKLLAAADPDGQRTTLHRLFRFQGTLALLIALGCVALLFLRSWWPATLQGMMPVLLLLPLLVIVVTLRDFLLAATAGCHAYKRRAQTIVVSASLQVAFFAVLYFLGIESPFLFVGAYVVAAVGGLGAALGLFPRTLGLCDETAFPTGWFFVRKNHRRDTHHGASSTYATERELPLSALRFAAPLYVNNLMNFIFQRVDTLLIVAWLGLGSAAIYEMVKRLPNLLSRLLRAALVPYLPSLSELLRDKESAQAGKLIQQTILFAAFAGYAVTLLLIALEEALLTTLFNADYLEGTAALGPLLIATCLAVQAGVMGQALIALDRPKVVMVINFGLAATSLLLNLLLVPRFGLVGAGWSAVAAAGFSLLMQRLAVSRAGIPLPFQSGVLIHVLFAAAVIINHTVASGMMARMGGAVGFVALCLALGAVKLETPRQEPTS